MMKNLFGKLGKLMLIGLAGAGANSCISPPDFPVTPEITFDNIRLVRRVDPQGFNLEENDIYLTLKFQDGDGDLGLDPDDLNVAPYNIKTGGRNNQGFGKNIYIQPFKKVNGVFVPFTTSTLPVGSLDSVYPRLDESTDGKPAPLQGSFTYKKTLKLDFSNFDTDDVVKFQISILDRALHESNSIMTSEIVLGR